jgi:hypothetical protein
LRCGCPLSVIHTNPSVARYSRYLNQVNAVVRVVVGDAGGKQRASMLRRISLRRGAMCTSRFLAAKVPISNWLGGQGGEGSMKGVSALFVMSGRQDKQHESHANQALGRHSSNMQHSWEVVRNAVGGCTGQIVRACMRACVNESSA